MDIEVKDLIDRIKKEGLEAASGRAAEIQAEAEARAGERLRAAEAEAARILSSAREEARAAEASGRASLEQAGRDLLLKLRESISKTFDEVVRREVAAGLSAETLAAVLPPLILAWQKQDADDLAVLLPPKDLVRVEAILRDKLASAFRGGLEVRPFAELTAGFRIVEKGGAVYTDFSDEALAELLGRFLHPRLEETLKRAAES